MAQLENVWGNFLQCSLWGNTLSGQQRFVTRKLQVNSWAFLQFWYLLCFEVNMFKATFKEKISLLTIFVIKYGGGSDV